VSQLVEVLQAKLLPGQLPRHTTLSYDRYDRDYKIPLYAQGRVPEVWLVNILERLVEVFTQPTPKGYGRILIRRAGDTLFSKRMPGVSIEVAVLF
jgi:Uma2 family endonuclease